ncbi:MAG: hypothetical protein IKF18_05275 [Erysipelotrichaceae bacterium]|nr:hypothetical protein [Erysipelotrichaceae bacterium]
MLNRFKETHGKLIIKIAGQNRLAYAFSDFADLYDLTEWAQRGGYQGSVIYFYDLANGSVYHPFEKKRNVAYGKPVYFDGFYYFLRADYDRKDVLLYKYVPEKEPEVVKFFDLREMDLYNLAIMGEGINVVSQSDKLTCYYPSKFSFELKDNETVTMIKDGSVYVEAWVEEGWDHQNNCASENYEYYNKVIVKDFEGKTLSEERGCLFQNDDGNWWIA